MKRARELYIKSLLPRRFVSFHHVYHRRVKSRLGQLDVQLKDRESPYELNILEHINQSAKPDILKQGGLSFEKVPRKEVDTSDALHRVPRCPVGSEGNFMPKLELLSSSGWNCSALPQDLVNKICQTIPGYIVA